MYLLSERRDGSSAWGKSTASAKTFGKSRGEGHRLSDVRHLPFSPLQSTSLNYESIGYARIAITPWNGYNERHQFDH
jgi:hypothetical protein